VASTVVVCGALANKPGNGGEAWVRLSWVRGFVQLGFDVWFVEELAPGSPDLDSRAWFASVLDEFGLLERAALLQGGRVVAGSAPVRDAHELRGLIGSAALLVNISGALRDPDLLAAARLAAYVDLDPGYTQIWYAEGADLGLGRHQLHFTVGERVGRPGWPVPTNGVSWQPCRQPVVLTDWPVVTMPPDPPFTTVTTWRCPFGPATWDSHVYPTKHHGFRSLLELPARVDVPLELAVAMHDADHADRDRFVAAGWQVRDARDVASTPADFRSYVQSSRGELSTAQGVYVETRSGWFSDRTVRYLASGRPAVVQDTGVGDTLPTGDGLLTFADADDAAEALTSILHAPEHHGRAARELAEAHFDARVVLADFVDRCEIAP
jgi:hypothetical protein